MKKVKTVIFVFVCVILCFVLQSTILSRLSFGGVQANLMIIETAAFAFCLGDVGGLFVGFFSGLLCDIFFGPLIVQHLLCQSFVGGGDLAFAIMGKDALALNAGFCCPDGERDFRFKDVEHGSRLPQG